MTDNILSFIYQSFQGTTFGRASVVKFVDWANVKRLPDMTFGEDVVQYDNPALAQYFMDQCPSCMTSDAMISYAWGILKHDACRLFKVNASIRALLKEECQNFRLMRRHAAESSCLEFMQLLNVQNILHDDIEKYVVGAVCHGSIEKANRLIQLGREARIESLTRLSIAHAFGVSPGFGPTKFVREIINGGHVHVLKYLTDDALKYDLGPDVPPDSIQNAREEMFEACIYGDLIDMFKFVCDRHVANLDELPPGLFSAGQHSKCYQYALTHPVMSRMIRDAKANVNDYVIRKLMSFIKGAHLDVIPPAPTPTQRPAPGTLGAAVIQAILNHVSILEYEHIVAAIESQSEEMFQRVFDIRGLHSIGEFYRLFVKHVGHLRVDMSNMMAYAYKRVTDRQDELFMIRHYIRTIVEAHCVHMLRHVVEYLETHFMTLEDVTRGVPMEFSEIDFGSEEYVYTQADLHWWYSFMTANCPLSLDLYETVMLRCIRYNWVDLLEHMQRLAINGDVSYDEEGYIIERFYVEAIRRGNVDMVKRIHEQIFPNISAALLRNAFPRIVKAITLSTFAIRLLLNLSVVPNCF